MNRHIIDKLVDEYITKVSTKLETNHLYGQVNVNVICNISYSLTLQNPTFCLFLVLLLIYILIFYCLISDVKAK